LASAVDAVQCAVEIQQALKTKNTELASDKRMEFRIGINVGDVIVEGPQIYGDGVNIAARLEALAEGGGICISGTVYDQVENKLTLGYESLGEQTVKNIAKPVRVYRVVLESGVLRQASPEPSRRTQHERLSDPVTLSLSKGDQQPLAIPLPDKPSIVVLPFVNMSQDPEQEYFSDGITEDITADLSKISGLFVIARTSAFAYKGKAVKVQDVGREMGVAYVLEGSVRKVGTQVRITAQLIDATTGFHLWTERYDRPLQDLFAVQDEITQQIVTTLRVKVQEAELARVRRIPTENLNAYDSLLRGMDCMRRTTKEMNAQARQMFERAVALDPKYAEAYTRLGTTYFLEWLWQWNLDPQTLERAVELAQKALVLDDSLGLAHALLGMSYLWTMQNEQAIAAQEWAVALDPNSATGWGGLAEALSWSGRPAEALGFAQQALRRNPLTPAGPLFELGLAH
jgi:adenylate cyclase